MLISGFKLCRNSLMRLKFWVAKLIADLNLCTAEIHAYSLRDLGMRLQCIVSEPDPRDYTM